MRLLLPNLQPGRQYTVQIRSDDGEAQSEWSRAFTFTTSIDTRTPNTPQNVTWVSSGDNFHAEWDAVQTYTAGQTAYVTGYEVELVASGTTKIVSVPNKTDGTKITYDLLYEANRALFGTARAVVTFRVRAVDNKGLRSAWTAVLTATNAAPAAPTAPTGGVASNVVDGVKLVWVPPADTDVTHYNVYTSTAGSTFTPSAANRVFSGNATTFTYNTQTYSLHYFKIRAVDKFGQESTDLAAQGTPQSAFVIDTTAPAAPTGFSVTIQDDPNGLLLTQTALATWTKPTGDTSIQGYHVRYRESGTTNWSFADAPADVAFPFVVSKTLEPNKAYDFEVRTYDVAANKSAWVALATNAQAPAVVPQLVTALKVGGGGYIESASYTPGGTIGFRIDDDEIVINNGQIRGQAITSGQIRSNQPAKDANGANIAGEYAWQIDLQGDMVVGSAKVRGSLVVGQSGETQLSKIQSYNYSPGATGWMIRSDGYADLRNIAANSLYSDRLSIGAQTVSVLANGNMEDPRIGTTGVDYNGFGGWQASTIVGNGGTITANTTSPISGTRSMRITTPNATSGQRVIQRDYKPVTGGQVWKVSALMKATRVIDKRHIAGEDIASITFHTSAAGVDPESAPGANVTWQTVAAVEAVAPDYTRTITTTDGSTMITATSPFRVGSEGMKISGPGIPPEAIIESIVQNEATTGTSLPSTTAYLSVPATTVVDESGAVVSTPGTGTASIKALYRLEGTVTVPQGHTRMKVSLYSWPANDKVRTALVNTTAASTTVTTAEPTFTLSDIGAAITGTGIPAGATINSVQSDKQVMISAAATATATGVTATITTTANGYAMDWDEVYCIPATTDMSIYNPTGGVAAHIDSDGNAVFNDIDYSGELRASGTTLLIDGAPIGESLITGSLETTELPVFAGVDLTNHIRDNYRLKFRQGLHTGVNTTTAAGATKAFLEAAFPCVANHVYRISYYYNAQTGGTAGTQFDTYMVSTEDGTTPSTTNGTEIIASYVRCYLHTNLWTTYGKTFYWDSSATGTARIVFFAKSISGNNMAISFGGNLRPNVMVEDMGPVAGVSKGLVQRNPDSGTSAPAPTTDTETQTLTKYTKTFGAIWTAGYNQAGGRISNGRDHKHGYYSSTNGNTKGAVGFDSADIRAKLSGVTNANIIKTEVYVYFNHWWYDAGGTAIIGTHNDVGSSAPTDWANIAGKTPDRRREANWPKPGGRWVEVPNSWAQDLRDGAMRGLLLGPAPSTAREYYGTWNGKDQANAPKIRITYKK